MNAEQFAKAKALGFSDRQIAHLTGNYRDSIVDAMFELVGEGVLEPTADRVATRAGVGLRSVFRHFTDMESLYAALAARLRREVEPIAGEVEPIGSLATRARRMVERRARLFERIAPYKRAANLHRQRSPFLDAEHGALVLALRTHLLRGLPELRRAPRAVLDALELAISFEAWDRLRRDQGLSPARARAAQEAAVCEALWAAEGSGPLTPGPAIERVWLRLNRRCRARPSCWMCGMVMSWRWSADVTIVRANSIVPCRPGDLQDHSLNHLCIWPGLKRLVTKVRPASRLPRSWWMSRSPWIPEQGPGHPKTTTGSIEGRYRFERRLRSR